MAANTFKHTEHTKPLIHKYIFAITINDGLKPQNCSVKKDPFQFNLWK